MTCCGFQIYLDSGACGEVVVICLQGEVELSAEVECEHVVCVETTTDAVHREPVGSLGRRCSQDPVADLTRDVRIRGLNLTQLFNREKTKN